MGARVSSRRRETRVVMLGMDAAGKTSVLYRLVNNEAVATIPTIGFNVETVKVRGTSMTVWDVGGQDSMLPLWSHYYQGMDAVVFVVDASDRDRMPREELQKVRRDVADVNSGRPLPLLVLWNKTDADGSANVSQARPLLGLAQDDDTVHVQATVAHTGVGLQDGFGWLVGRLKKERKRK